MSGLSGAKGLSPTIAVTGAGGFIGPPVVAALHARGLRVRAHAGPHGFAGRPLPEAVEVVHADIIDASARAYVRALSVAVARSRPDQAIGLPEGSAAGTLIQHSPSGS